MSDQRHPTPVGSLKIMALELAEALIQAEISNVDPTDSLRIVERRHWLIEAALHKAYSLAPRSETVARQDIPEGRGSLPAGALERGSPLDAARGVNPGGAAPGGVSERCDDKVGGALCEHKNQMWNIQFTHGHCKDCGAEFGLVQSAVGATDAKHEELARTLRQALFVTKAGFPAVPLNMALDALADLASTISPQSASGERFAQPPAMIRAALLVLLGHIEPGWDNCKWVVQEWIEGRLDENADGKLQNAADRTTPTP